MNPLWLHALGRHTGFTPREFALRLIAGHYVKWRDPYHGVAELEGLVLGQTIIVDNQCVTEFTFHMYSIRDGYVDIGYCPLQFEKEEGL